MTKNNTALEAQEAIAFSQWLSVRGIWHTHVPNDTGSSPEARRRAIKMKREGTSPGFFDYIVIVPPELSVDGESYCLMIELKRLSGSRVSKEQQAWHDHINAMKSNNIPAYMAKGSKAASDIVSHYLCKVSDSVF